MCVCVCVCVCVGFFKTKIAKGSKSRLGGGIHVSVYVHVNVCTMIVQNGNAQGGTKSLMGHKILKGGSCPLPLKTTTNPGACVCTACVTSQARASDVISKL